MRVLNFGVENLILNKFQEALNSQRRARDDVRLTQQTIKVQT